MTTLRLTRRGRAVRAVLLVALALLLALWLAPNRGGVSLPPYPCCTEMGR